MTGLQVKAAVPFCSGHNKSESASAGQLCDETKFDVESNTPKAAIAVHNSCICHRQSSDQARLVDTRTAFVADRIDSTLGCDCCFCPALVKFSAFAMSGVVIVICISEPFNGLGAGVTDFADCSTLLCTAGILNTLVQVSCKVSAASTMRTHLRACSTHLWLSCTHPHSSVFIGWVSDDNASTDVSTMAKLMCT